MSEWASGIFDDDTAYDYLSVIKASTNPKEIFKDAFETASKNLDYDDCHAGIVTAAYMHNLLTKTMYILENNEEKNVNCFGERNQSLDSRDLKPGALLTLNKLISGNSELNQQGSQNKELYPKWKQNIVVLIDRIN